MYTSNHSLTYFSIPLNMSCTIQYLSLGEWYTIKHNVPMKGGKPESFHFSDKGVIHRFVIGESTYDSIYERIGPPGKMSFSMRWVDEGSDEFIKLFTPKSTDKTTPVDEHSDDDGYFSEEEYFSDDSEGYWFSMHSRKFCASM